MESVTVIIPNTNSSQIGRILQAIKRQAAVVPDLEILVVGEDQPGLVEEDNLVRFVPCDPAFRFASDKRNLGIQSARGDVLIFIDDDCIPVTNWLKRHLQRHQAGEQVVGGAVTFESQNYFQLADNVSAFHEWLCFTPEGSRPYLTTANLSMRRSVIETVGPLVPHKNRAEDLEWTLRCKAHGFRLYFEPQARVLHNPQRCNFEQVWNHWSEDAPHTLQVRLAYAELLGTSRWAAHRWLFFLGAPFIALWATARTFRNSQTLSQFWHTLPLVYLTKIAWCWGAYAHFTMTRMALDSDQL